MDALTLAQEIIDGRRITREDDLNFGDLGCYGQKYISTPNIDRMAQSTDGVDDVQRTASTARSLHTTTQAARSMISFRKKRS